MLESIQMNSSENCIFCHQITLNQVLYQTKYFIVVFDTNPVQEGHLLIISRNHHENIITLTKEELRELITLERELAKLLENQLNILGVTIIQNNGRVMMENTHFHVHIIPRYTDDQFWEQQKVVKKQIDDRQSLSRSLQRLKKRK